MATSLGIPSKNIIGVRNPYAAQEYIDQLNLDPEQTALVFGVSKKDMEGEPAMGIPPEYRSNFDYIFLLAEDTISNRKRLYEHYAGMFPTFDIFQQVFTDITEDYGMMVINNRIHSKNITDKVFWYKAKKAPPFKVGCRKFHKFHQESYDSNWNRRLEVFNPADLIVKKRNNLRVLVEKVH
jgi:hypothetical protein